MSRTEVLKAFSEQRCSAILRTPHAEAVAPAMAAAIAGGFRIVEFTLNTPGALEQIAAHAADDGLVVGAGTVLDVAQARAAVDAGARFLVSPVGDAEVIGWCRENDIVSVPGCLTPTEMLAAHRAGADLIKLFPAPPGGPDYVKVVRGPLPFLPVFPTSGVTLDNVEAYFAAGAYGVGFVNCLFELADLAAGRFEAVEERARRMVAAARAAATRHPLPE